MNFKVVVLFWVVAGIVSVRAEIPDYIKTCRRNDANVTQCIVGSILHLKPRLKFGIPEIKLPGFEPLIMDDIYLQNDPKSSSNQAKLTEIKVFGFSDFQLETLSVDMQEHTFTFSLRLPYLRFFGNYQLKIKFSFLNIQDKGQFSGNLTDYKFMGLLRGHMVQKDGVQYLQFEKMKMDKSIGKVYVYLENLFNGDPELTGLANAILNENAEMLFGEIRPALENAISSQITTTANRIVGDFPYDELFPI